MKVMIAAPLRQKPEIFEQYQEALDKLIVPSGVEVERFFVVNNCDEVIPYIHDATVIKCDMNAAYDDHQWNDGNLSKMHYLRDLTRAAALESGADYLMSVDTDLILHPNTLECLLDADKDIVSEIFFTEGWCNGWMVDQYDNLMLEQFKTAGLYRVGMLGGLYLIKRQALEAGCCWARIPNILKCLWGEDRHFCIRAACLGFEMWMDTHFPITHLYRAKDYEKFMADKSKV